MSLQGKTALISGVGSSLSLDITRAFLSQGANVVVSGIYASHLTALKDEYNGSEFADHTLVLQADVSEEESVRKLVAAAVEKFYRLDIVVNDAAIMYQSDPAETCDEGLRAKAMAVNLTGPFLVAKYAAQQIEAQQPSGGLIINIASNSCARDLTAKLDYSATKHGILVLTKNMARFYGPKGVYSVGLLLGGIDTTNTKDAFFPMVNQEGVGLFGTRPEHGCVPTEDVARYMLYLTGEGIGKSANGSHIRLNGNELDHIQYGV
ncbi:hypothetical protein EDB81DRAFT_823546 [Dactylonectria macrodidyma]|uniref:Uncharacterized protein n=1 Tax=Dactylonectria macrodidyma TaxID=307937 RepID=A0A9P9D7B2_9HYPO|nr:hypothetical protein EDB81DRAFT_823546 [Dactylonectria macrodidyma]